MKRAIYFLAGCALAFVAYRVIDDRRAEAFAEVMEAEQAGYRLEHFERERLLFLHAPDGSKDGMPLDSRCIYQVAARRIPAEDNALGKDLYRWEVSYVLGTGEHSWIRRSLLVPLFAVEPADLLRLVKLGVPELDVALGVALAEQVKRGDLDTGVVWSHPDHDPDRYPKPEAMCAPSP